MRLGCGAVVEMKNKGKMEGNEFSLETQNSERVRRVNIGKVDRVSMVEDYIHIYNLRLRCYKMYACLL